MTKIYRRPKIKDGQIKMQRHKLDGAIDDCIFYGDNIQRCDRALLMTVIYSNPVCEGRSLLEELEYRGYDMDTFRFSIEKRRVSDEG